MPAPDESRAWFTTARFGIFIHWGLCSVHGRDVWSMYNEQTPVEEYRRLADQFAPRRWDPHEWAALARDAGARYMVLCTRHHDGFSLWDSRVSDFTSTRSAAKRDFVAEYAEAMRRAGLGVGFYYSLLDWRLPAYFGGPERDADGWAQFRAYVHAQVRELCTNYGRVDILWYDGAWPYDAADWGSEELNAMVRSLQPHILINNGAGLPEDFDAYEPKTIPANYLANVSAGLPEDFDPAAQRAARSEPGRLWEACMTMNDHWGYVPADTHWQTTTQLLHNLVRCASGNGNYLLNVGPDPDGAIPPEGVTRLREIGRWLRAYGEAIYGTERAGHLRHVGMVGLVHPFPTLKGNTLFAHVYKWPGRELVLGNLARRVVAVRFVDGGAPIPFRQEGSRVFLTRLPPYAPDPHDTVIAVECDGPPQSIDRHAERPCAGTQRDGAAAAAPAPGAEEGWT